MLSILIKSEYKLFISLFLLKQNKQHKAREYTSFLIKSIFPFVFFEWYNLYKLGLINLLSFWTIFFDDRFTKCSKSVIL